MDLLDRLAREDVSRCTLWSDPSSGLRAVLVIDDVTLGPAAGGVRTRAYPSLEAALTDAAGLARAMTLKCALAGLDAGGGKAVVLDHPGLDRTRAFEVLGARVDELGGLFRTAGDLGTTPTDIEAMSRRTRYVHADDDDRLARAVARGLEACLRACATVRGRQGNPGDRNGDPALERLSVLVQGCGAIGSAVARRLAARGVRLHLVDVDDARARTLADELGASVVPRGEIWTRNVDVVAPCATGGVLTSDVARRLRAWAICGAANNQLGDAEAAHVLAERGVLLVPDPIGSAGAVIEGIGRTVMGLDDPGTLIDRLGDTAREVLEQARAEGRTAPEVAEERARQRIARGR